MKITKYILSLWVIAVGVLVLYIFGNNFTPLGYDHGAYRHYIGLIETYGQADEMIVQFESFFGAFVRVLTVALPSDLILTWWYLIVYIATSVCVFILGKNKNKYTLASYIGWILAIISLVQYRVFWLWLGKEMFATIFLLLSIRYYKKTSIYIIFTSVCIALHRLTGIFAVVFALTIFITDKRSWQKKIYILMSIVLGIICYIPAIKIHILPLISWNITQHILIPGGSGTLFLEKIFWSAESIILFGGIIFTYFYHKKSRKYTYKSKKYYYFLITAILLILRISGHTRIWAFFDIFLIIYMSQMAVFVTHKKYILTIIAIQGMLWLWYTYQNHKPTISTGDLSAIEHIKENMIESQYLINFSENYTSWILGYSGLNIESLYGIKIKKTTQKEKIHMRDNPEQLCSLLDWKKQTVYIFMGWIEKTTFPQKAICIKEVTTFANWAKIFIYRAR